MCYILVTGCDMRFCQFIIERMRKMITKINKNNGITLIALVVTIIVLLILAGISISMLTGQNGILNRAAEAKEKTEKAQSEERIKVAVMSSLKTDGLIDSEKLKAEIESQGVTVTGTAFPITATKGNTSFLISQYGNITDLDKVENIEAHWKVADSGNTNDDWYAYKDNSGNKAQVNAPKLADGMLPIKYETEVTGSKWANAMTIDGSMWVWIPRYAYKITYKDANDRSKGGTIDIAFLNGTTNEFLDTSISGELKNKLSDVTFTTNDDGTKSQDQWLLEPAFTFGNESIEGFWFAKFEASNTDGYGSDASTANNPNLTLQIKPNIIAWRNITAANMFTVCLDLISTNKYNTYFNNVSNIDTHMTKNVEWGAIAYLAHSKYGLNGEEICINTNSSFITGVGSDTTDSTTSVTDKYNTVNGVTASTTRNVYGIYDMSGGSWEYVAACLSGYTDKLTSDSAYISKYIDVCDNYISENFGDAVFETSTNSSKNNSWFSDWSIFVYSDYPVFRRGGDHINGFSAGLFGFDNDDGNNYRYNGFRPVCIVK